MVFIDLKQSVRTYYNPGSGYVSMTISHIPFVIVRPNSELVKMSCIFTVLRRRTSSLVSCTADFPVPWKQSLSGGRLHGRVYQASRRDGWIYFSPASKGCNLAPIFRNWALYRWGLSQLLFSEVCLWGHSAS